MRFRANLALPLLLMLTGCGGVVYQQDPQTGKFVETHRFRREIDYTYFSIDTELAEEKQGRRPSGGCRTWQEFWDRAISAWRRQNHPEFEQYFLRRRQEMGLKDIAKR